jgi:hypothetical protein
MAQWTIVPRTLLPQGELACRPKGENKHSGIL